MANLNYQSLLLVLLLFLLLSSCEEEGCTDSKALNTDYAATVDDGSCIYSDVVFYGSQFSPCPPVVVQVNGSSIGNITASYPGGPGNCSVPGVAYYTFSSGEKIDYVALDDCGRIFSGTVTPSSVNDCIKVRVF